jgi:hypothetical protein
VEVSRGSEVVMESQAPVVVASQASVAEAAPKVSAATAADEMDAAGRVTRTQASVLVSVVLVMGVGDGVAADDARLGVMVVVA